MVKLNWSQNYSRRSQTRHAKVVDFNFIALEFIQKSNWWWLAGRKAINDRRSSQSIMRTQKMNVFIGIHCFRRLFRFGNGFRTVLEKKKSLRCVVCRSSTLSDDLNFNAVCHRMAFLPFAFSTIFFLLLSVSTTKICIFIEWRTDAVLSVDQLRAFLRRHCCRRCSFSHYFALFFIHHKSVFHQNNCENHETLTQSFLRSLVCFYQGTQFHNESSRQWNI